MAIEHLDSDPTMAARTLPEHESSAKALTVKSSDTSGL
jgi:hypothetical protein